MKIRTIAIYIRLSLEDQNVDGKTKKESNSISAQRDMLYDYVKMHSELMGAKVIEFCDDGHTGTDFNRAEFKKMISAIESGEISCVIVKDFSRFGRDYIEVGHYLEHIFPQLQVRFISVNDGYDSFNSKGMTGGMSIGLKNLIYNMYSTDLSKKVRSARDTRVRKGEYISPFTKYGYIKSKEDIHKIVIDPEPAAVVRKVFHLAASGYSIANIVRYLNVQGIPTCSEYKMMQGSKLYNPSVNGKKSWCTKTIRLMIEDEIYLGNTVWNKSEKSIATGHVTRSKEKTEWIICKGTHEQIIERELFDEANRRLVLKKREKTEKKSKQVLFICGKCGRALSRYDTLSPRLYCRNRSYQLESSCRDVIVEREVLEQNVLEYVKKTADILLDKIMDKKGLYNPVEKLRQELTDLKQEVKRLTGSKMDLYEKYKSNQIERERYKDSINAITERIDKANLQIVEINNSIEQEQEKQVVEQKVDQLYEIKELEKFNKEIIMKLIQSIKVFSAEEIEVIWKAEDIFFQTEHVG